MSNLLRILKINHREGVCLFQRCREQECVLYLYNLWRLIIKWPTKVVTLRQTYSEIVIDHYLYISDHEEGGQST